MKYVLFIINILVIAITIGCYLAPVVEPGKLALFPVLSVLTPYFIIANVGFVLFWILVKPKYLFYSGLTLVLGFSTLQRHFNFFSASDQTEQTSNQLTIASLNVNSGQYLRKDKHTLNADRVASFQSWAASLDTVDILLAQEKRYFGQVMLDSILSSKFIRHGNDTIGTGIYSKLPIVDKGFVKVGGNTNYAAWADIKQGRHIVRVYSIHGSSNMISKQSKRLIKETKLNDSSFWNEVKGLFGNYTKYSQQRLKQLSVLKAHIQKSPNPVILGGDFNDVPQSYLYQQVSRTHRDAFVKKGKGIGRTYRGPLPGLRIDYLFAEEEMEPTHFSVDKYDISDHYPIRATFDLSQ